MELKISGEAVLVPKPDVKSLAPLLQEWPPVVEVSFENPSVIEQGPIVTSHSLEEFVPCDAVLSVRALLSSHQ